MSREKNEDNAISRYDEILNNFMNLAINRFKWSNLPIGLTSEILEKMLIENGLLLCFKRDGGGVIILPCYGQAKVNIYNQYDKYIVNGANGFNDTIDIEKSVLLRNNPLGTDDKSNLMIYAKRLDNLEMTQDVNMFQQNIPKIILTDETGKLTAKALIDQLRNFKVAIFGKKTLTSQLTSSDVLDTTAPFLLDKLQDHKNALINEVLTYLGINNANTDKKERVVVDEVNANNDLINIMLDLMYDMRTDFCKLANEMFNTNMSVEKRRVEENGRMDNDNNGNIGE